MRQIQQDLDSRVAEGLAANEMEMNADASADKTESKSETGNIADRNGVGTLTSDSLAHMSEADLVEKMLFMDETLATVNQKLQAQIYTTLSPQENELLMNICHTNQQSEIAQQSIQGLANFKTKIRKSEECRSYWDSLRITPVFTIMREKLQKIEKDRELARGDLEGSQFVDPNDTTISAEKRASSMKLMQDVAEAFELNQQLGKQLQAESTLELEKELKEQKAKYEELLHTRQDYKDFIEQLDEELEACQSLLMDYNARVTED